MGRAAATYQVDLPSLQLSRRQCPGSPEQSQDQDLQVVQDEEVVGNAAPEKPLEVPLASQWQAAAKEMWELLPA